MDGRVMLVTGASRGIGAATARLAAARGYDVALNFQRDDAAAARVAADVRELGRRAVTIRGDVGKRTELLALFDRVDQEFGRLDVLVNNAGIVGTAGRLDAADPDMIEQVITLNTTGAILAAREAVRRMSTRHGGSGGVIVNLSSRAVDLGGPGEYVWYAASKGAIDSFTIGLAREVATEGIRVVAVAPGLIETDIHASGGQPDRVQRFAPVIPMQRAGKAEEVAETILFLASDAASYVTGAVLDIGGGR